jgi:hypothetical protein
MDNTFQAMVVSGKKGDRTWTGVAVQVIVNGIEYKGIIFPKNDTITPDKAIKFSK